DSMLGRVNGSMNVLGEGIGTLGLLFGGVLAEQIGLRSTVAGAALGSLLGCVWILCSPLPRLRDLPLVEDTNRQEREERPGEERRLRDWGWFDSNTISLTVGEVWRGHPEGSRAPPHLPNGGGLGAAGCPHPEGERRRPQTPTQSVKYV